MNWTKCGNLLFTFRCKFESWERNEICKRAPFGTDINIFIHQNIESMKHCSSSVPRNVDIRGHSQCRCQALVTAKTGTNCNNDYTEHSYQHQGIHLNWINPLIYLLVHSHNHFRLRQNNNLNLDRLFSIEPDKRQRYSLALLNQGRPLSSH